MTAVRLWGLSRAKKEQKLGQKKGQKHKIAYYEAKLDFKVPKMHSWLVKLIFYLTKSARSILKGLKRTKKRRAKNRPNKGPKHKIAHYEAKLDFKVP